MPPTREEFDQALERLCYPNHPDGKRSKDNYEETIAGYADELEEQVQELGGTLLGEEEEDVIEQEAGPEGVGAEGEPESGGEGQSAATEGPSESSGGEGDIQTSTGPGGSSEGVPGT